MKSIALAWNDLVRVAQGTDHPSSGHPEALPGPVAIAERPEASSALLRMFGRARKRPS
jgi:hypothetical protein